MAQLRRYSNVLHPYLGSHNMNGNSERVEQREKAKIERVQTSDLETNKKPSSSPLFPPPRKVSDSSDEITKTIKTALGDYNNFVKIMNQEVSREKAPGQTCIGVMPVPPTPTETKTPHFPSASVTNKPKPKEKPSNSTSTQEKPKGNAAVEKSDQKHKSSLDTSRQKTMKLGEKLNEKKDNKDAKNRISLEKYKSNQATVSVGDKSNTLSINKHKSSTCVVKDEATANNISQEVNNEVEKVVVKKEETIETVHEEATKKMEKVTPVQKTKPTPLLLPVRNASSSSLLQSPQHRDMKLQHIFKEMTETVNMPLTGICTPLPAKQDSHFSFPNNIKEKENSEVPVPTNSFIADLDISDDEDSEDEKGNVDDQSERPAGQTRSRSSSSSSSSSSGDSSDSEPEEADDHQKKPSTVVPKISTLPKTSMLNAMSSPAIAVKTPSPVQAVTAPSPVQAVTTTPKHDTNDNLGKSIDETLHVQTSSKSTSDEILCKSRTSSSKPDDTILLEKSDEDILNIKDSKGSTDKVDHEQNNEPKSADKLKVASPSAGQKHTHSLNRTKAEIKESLPDTKIRIKVEKGSNDSFKVKTDSKIKSETKKKSESEVGEVKNNVEKGKSAEKSVELNSKSNSKNVKLKKNVNGVVKPSKEEKIEVKKKEKKIDEQPVVQKKTKRKHKDSTGESGKPTKDTSDLHSSKEKSDVNVSKDKTEVNPSKVKTDEISSKDRNRTKSGNKEKKRSDRTESFGFDILSDEVEEEDSVIDVVGDGSPLVKKKKTEQNKMNGVHKNGHVDLPLGIQLVHDKNKDPTSLIVKIPLSFLKRIPSKFGEDLSVESSRAGAELSSLKDSEKIPKDWSGKKNGENGDMEVDHNDEIANEKKLQQSNHGKRSSSWDSGHHQKKRIRRDSQRDKPVTEQKKRKTLAELSAECEADIRRVEPDAHLLQAKTLKRQADKLTDKEAKSRTYVEAIVRFICCGKALEDKDDGELRSVQMYSDTTELLRFILKHVLGRTEDKRLLILCLRVQSLLLHKLYRMKSKQVIRNTQILAEHFKGTHKNNITSPYTTSNKHVSTPSPMSPTPSPAGSVGSTGSNGSNTSSEGNNSHNYRHASTASVTSPVSVSIPQNIHGVMAQHVSSTSKLVNSIDMWDKADNLASEYQGFFTTVDSICGALTFHSSMPHIVNYVKNSLSNFHEHGKET